MATPAIKRVRSKTIYRGRVATLSLDTFRTSEGRSFLRETIQHPPSVVILPLTPSGKILLIRQYRHAVGRWIYEIPAGTSEPGEPLLRCAQRELAEETGHRAAHWQRLCEFYPAPGISTERMALYVASGATPLKRGTHLDDDEHIALLPTPPAKALQMVRDNRIVDAKSIIGILWGLRRVRW